MICNLCLKARETSTHWMCVSCLVYLGRLDAVAPEYGKLLMSLASLRARVRLDGSLRQFIAAHHAEHNRLFPRFDSSVQRRKFLHHVRLSHDLDLLGGPLSSHEMVRDGDWVSAL